jgi:hypothetical protein
MWTSTTLAAISVLCLSPLAIAQSEADDLLVKLDGPLDNVLLRLESLPLEAKTLPALRAEFERRQEKGEKQKIASTLLRLGDTSDRYFQFLAGYAKAAIDDRTPLWEKFDREGRWVRGEFSAEFETWCELNHRKPSEVAAIQFRVYTEDVKFLAEIDDRRSIDLLRRGLESPYPGVVAYSVEGLGRSQDVSAIPLIARAFERLPVGDRMGVAVQLPWYASPDAYQLMVRLDPNPRSREYSIQMVQMQRQGELKRIQSRTSLQE